MRNIDQKSKIMPCTDFNKNLDCTVHLSGKMELSYFVKFILKRSIWIVSGKYAPLFTFYLIEIQQVW